jgi:hypothetical protein
MGGSPSAPTASTVVSMFEANSLAVKCERVRDAIVYFELEGHEWAAAGFELPTLVVEAEFDAGYYEAEALRLLRQRRQ